MRIDVQVTTLVEPPQSLPVLVSRNPAPQPGLVILGGGAHACALLLEELGLVVALLVREEQTKGRFGLGAQTTVWPNVLWSRVVCPMRSRRRRRARGARVGPSVRAVIALVLLLGGLVHEAVADALEWHRVHVVQPLVPILAHAQLGKLEAATAHRQPVLTQKDDLALKINEEHLVDAVGIHVEAERARVECRARKRVWPTGPLVPIDAIHRLGEPHKGARPHGPARHEQWGRVH